MDIKKLQSYALSNAMSPSLFNRIMSNELTIDDVNFLEKGMNAKSLIEIRMTTENLLNELQKLGLELNGRKNENGVEYTLKLVDWMIENTRFIHDRCEDIGLTDIEVKESEDT